MNDTEKGVKDRLDQERSELAGRLKELDSEWLACSGGEQRALHRLDRLVGGMRERLADAKPLAEDVRDRITEATAEVERALKALVPVAQERADVTQRLRRLGTKAELQRRMKEAKRLAELRAEVDRGWDRGMGKRAAEVVLLEAGEPLHYREITRRALEAGLIRTEGKTPKQTISGYLVRGAQRGDVFVRVGPGVFDLASRQTEVGTG